MKRILAGIMGTAVILASCPVLAEDGLLDIAQAPYKRKPVSAQSNNEVCVQVKDISAEQQQTPETKDHQEEILNAPISEYGRANAMFNFTGPQNTGGASIAKIAEDASTRAPDEANLTNNVTLINKDGTAKNAGYPLGGMNGLPSDIYSQPQDADRSPAQKQSPRSRKKYDETAPQAGDR